MRLVLASGSPRRRELLTRLTSEFEVRAPDVDETPHEGERPTAYVERLARTKATAVPLHEDEVVVAGDTTIELDGMVFGKPRDADAATAMLTQLAGRAHHVHTGLAVRWGIGIGEAIETHVATTEVTMVPHDAALIEWYVTTGEPLDKAGAYAIQGRGDLLVAGVTGSVSNVVGLPLAVLVELLESGPGWSPVT